MPSPKAPAEDWKLTHTLVNALLLRRHERELLEEMKGIAAGATFDGRPIDLLDIVALNGWSEIESLDNALDALPTGLEGGQLPNLVHLPHQAAGVRACLESGTSMLLVAPF